VLVHRSLYDQTIEALKVLAASLKVGDATERDTIVGPLVTEAQRDRVEAMIKRGLDEGATLAAGGARPDVPGYAVAPTLLVDLKPDNFAVREEFFGPVVVVLPFDDEDEAVAMANDSDYGLYSYVFAGDIARGVDIARRLESGLVSVNGVQPHNFAPFGGFKMSGIGRDRGYWGLHAYSEIQSVNWAAV
jgi:phenylacetaldehyde dehydrogenase